jgi:hypothetical protein
METERQNSKKQKQGQGPRPARHEWKAPTCIAQSRTQFGFAVSELVGGRVKKDFATLHRRDKTRQSLIDCKNEVEQETFDSFFVHASETGDQSWIEQDRVDTRCSQSADEL